MNGHVFACDGYGIVAIDEYDALDVLRENEGDDLVDDIIDRGVVPARLPDDSIQRVDMAREDEEPRLVAKTCAEWITSAPPDILWRPA